MKLYNFFFFTWLKLKVMQDHFQQILQLIQFNRHLCMMVGLWDINRQILFLSGCSRRCGALLVDMPSENWVSLFQDGGPQGVFQLQRDCYPGKRRSQSGCGTLDQLFISVCPNSELGFSQFLLRVFRSNIRLLLQVICSLDNHSDSFSFWQ